jgi:hypothetical protein
MSDNENIGGTSDELQVDVRGEALFWAGELGCSRADLRRAVAEAGNSVSAVQCWLEATYPGSGRR